MLLQTKQAFLSEYQHKENEIATTGESSINDYFGMNAVKGLKLTLKRFMDNELQKLGKF